jgi:hypothetical protein
MLEDKIDWKCTGCRNLSTLIILTKQLATSATEYISIQKAHEIEI